MIQKGARVTKAEMDAWLRKQPIGVFYKYIFIKQSDGSYLVKNNPNHGRPLNPTYEISKRRVKSKRNPSSV